MRFQPEKAERKLAFPGSVSVTPRSKIAQRSYASCEMSTTVAGFVRIQLYLVAN